jgi:hypothetical protein
MTKVDTTAAAGRRPSISQLTWMAAGALVLFLMIGAVQMFQQHGIGAGRGTKLTSREFSALDRNHDGVLTRDEVKGDAVLEQNFDKIDKNHDGKLSLEEFTSYP